MNFLYRTELVCEMNFLYRTELVCCDGVAEVVLHTLVAAGKVYNPDCRKICLFRRDFPRDQYVAQGHECYNRYIRQESILSMLSTKLLLYFS